MGGPRGAVQPLMWTPRDRRWSGRARRRFAHYTRAVKAARTGPNAFTLEFESEDELREEHRVNLTQGGIRLPVADRLALFSAAELTLRGPSGCEARVKGTVVAPLPDGVALHFEGDADALLAALLAAPAEPESPGRMKH